MPRRWSRTWSRRLSRPGLTRLDTPRASAQASGPPNWDQDRAHVSPRGAQGVDRQSLQAAWAVCARRSNAHPLFWRPRPAIRRAFGPPGLPPGFGKTSRKCRRALTPSVVKGRGGVSALNCTSDASCLRQPPGSGCSTATSADFRASALQIAKQFAGIKAAEALYPPAPCPSRTERHRAAACPRSPWLSSGRLGRALVLLVASAEPVAGLFGWSPVDPGRQKRLAQDSMKRQPSNYSVTNCLGTQSNLWIKKFTRNNLQVTVCRNVFSVDKL